VPSACRLKNPLAEESRRRACPAQSGALDAVATENRPPGMDSPLRRVFVRFAVLTALSSWASYVRPGWVACERRAPPSRDEYRPARRPRPSSHPPGGSVGLQTPSPAPARSVPDACSRGHRRKPAGPRDQAYREKPVHVSNRLWAEESHEAARSTLVHGTSGASERSTARARIDSLWLPSAISDILVKTLR
jgi:hypothetical protein